MWVSYEQIENNEIKNDNNVIGTFQFCISANEHETHTIDFLLFLKYGFHPMLITILYTGPLFTLAQP